VVEGLSGKIPVSDSVFAAYLGHKIPARVVQFLPGYPDLALLAIDLQEHPCVSLGSEVHLGDPLAAHAYTAKHSGGEFATLKSEGLGQGEAAEEQLLKLKEGQVLPGFSGAPLLNLRTLRVCGLMKSRRDRLVTDLGGFAIPASVILRKLPIIAERQASFHAEDRRWDHARELQLRLPWDPTLYLSRATEKFLKEMEGSYVPLRLHSLAGIHKSRLAGEIPPETREENLPSWLHQRRRLLVVGPSGSGKTWLCKRLVVRLAEELSRSSSGEDACIPIYVEAGRYRGPYAHYKGFRDLAASGIELAGGFDAQISTEKLEEELACGRVLLFFDGLNEIGGARRTEALREITDLCEVFPEAKILVTCQTLGFSELIKTLAGLGFLGLEVDEFTDREIEDYFQEFGVAAERPVDTTVWSKLPRIPLILRLLVDAPERLPSDLSLPELLDRTVGFITRRTAVLPQRDRPKPVALERSLAQLAYRALLSGRVPPLLKEEVLDIFELAGSARSDEVLLAELCTMGLVEEAAGEIRFAHEVFFQYFVAMYLKEWWQDRDVQEDLRQYLREARWQEPFAFAVALMNPAEAMEAVRMALDQPRLAARCFYHLGAGASQELKESKVEFLRDQRTALVIAAMDWPKILLLASLASVSALSISAAVGWSSPPAIYLWLSGFAAMLKPQATLASTLVLAFGIVLNTFAVGLLLEVALHLYDRRVRVHFIEPIFDALVLLDPREARTELAQLAASLRKRPFVLGGVQQALSRAELQVARHSEVLEVMANHAEREPHRVLYALEVVERRAARVTEEDIAVVAGALNSKLAKIFKTALRTLSSIHDSSRRLRQQIEDVLQLQAEQEVHYARWTEINKTLVCLTGRRRSLGSRAQRVLQRLTSPGASGLSHVFRDSIWGALLTLLLFGIVLPVIVGLVYLLIF
jgi:hypothetical protein